MKTWECYTFGLKWSDEDREFVGLCAELPGLSWLSRSQIDALKGIVAAARDAVSILERDGDHVPDPLKTRENSEAVAVRVEPTGKRQHE